MSKRDISKIIDDLEDLATKRGAMDYPNPCAGMPGSRRKLRPEQQVPCESCQVKQATQRVQGETDSFGCEYLYLCDECVRASAEEDRAFVQSHTCDWCKKKKASGYSRDPDEGSCGPMYIVCSACRRKMNDALIEEERLMASVDDYDDGYDDSEGR